MNYPSIEESLKVIEASNPSDFDGHTNFSTLSAEERIRWASISAMAVFKAKEQIDIRKKEASKDD